MSECECLTNLHTNPLMGTRPEGLAMTKLASSWVSEDEKIRLIAPVRFTVHQEDVSLAAARYGRKPMHAFAAESLTSS